MYQHVIVGANEAQCVIQAYSDAVYINERCYFSVVFADAIYINEE